MPENVPEPIPAEESAVAPAPSETADGYQVRLGIFEGPLDLLLFLIRKKKIDIHDIPTAKPARRVQAL